MCRCCGFGCSDSQSATFSQIRERRGLPALGWRGEQALLQVEEFKYRQVWHTSGKKGRGTPTGGSKWRADGLLLIYIPIPTNARRCGQSLKESVRRYELLPKARLGSSCVERGGFNQMFNKWSTISQTAQKTWTLARPRSPASEPRGHQGDVS